MIEKKEREKEMKVKSYKILSMLLLPFMLSLAGCSVEPTANEGSLKFTQPLKIPPLLQPTVKNDGTKHFILTMQKGETEFLPGKMTDTYGINGSYLGPTIRVSRGDRVSLDVVNQLGETSTLHWHGMLLPASMDGGPHQMIQAGDTWSPHWTIDQPAATTWYHPHLHGKTASQVYKGLAGLFLLEDQDSEKLPSEYGVNDIPLVVQDKLFDEQGQFSEEMDLPPFGTLGDEILVNGTYDPYLEVTESMVRFRILNGSNARAYHLGFSDGRPFQVVANDAGLLEKPVSLDRLLLSPGERAEIVVQFEPGDETILHSYSGENGIDEGEFDLIKMVADSDLKDSAPLPDQISAIEPIEAPEDAKVRTFKLTTDSKINNKSMDMSRIDEVIAAGSREIWEITNVGWAHNFHIHDAAFRILDINGELPPEYERGRKDTVFIPAGATVRIAVEFGDHADLQFPYMYHCHLLRHEDDGMMGQFLLVEPGTEDQVLKELSLKENSDHQH